MRLAPAYLARNAEVRLNLLLAQADNTLSTLAFPARVQARNCEQCSEINLAFICMAKQRRSELRRDIFSSTRRSTGLLEVRVWSRLGGSQARRLATGVPASPLPKLQKARISFGSISICAYNPI